MTFLADALKGALPSSPEASNSPERVSTAPSSGMVRGALWALGGIVVATLGWTLWKEALPETVEDEEDRKAALEEIEVGYRSGAH
jgi:hypothetical protein